jgi:hypothetical protein
MAELLVVVVVVVVLLMYVADRVRKLRTRARQMAGMNDRLDAAAEKVDKEQRQRRAVVRASAELTSVMPAIKRPPLTIPGLAGPGDAADEADGEAVPDAVRPAAKSPSAGEVPAAEAGPPVETSPPEKAGLPVEADSPVVAGATAEVGRPAQAGASAEAGSPAGPSADETEDTPDGHDTPGAEPAPASAERAAAAPAPRRADDTLSMPAAIATDDMPVPKIQVTSEGTLIMRPVPDQGPVPAGEVLLAPDGIRDEPAARQERTNRR